MRIDNRKSSNGNRKEGVKLKLKIECLNSEQFF